MIYTRFSIEPEEWPGLQMEIPKGAGAKRFGAFTCSARDNATDITRTAVGVVLPTSGKAEAKDGMNLRFTFAFGV